MTLMFLQNNIYRQQKMDAHRKKKIFENLYFPYIAHTVHTCISKPGAYSVEIDALTHHNMDN